MKPPTFPMEVKNDSCTVTIYEREFTKPDKEGRPRRYVKYRLAYYQEGRRKIETSADFLALRTRADEVLDDIKDGRVDSTAHGSGAQRTRPGNQGCQTDRAARLTW